MLSTLVPIIFQVVKLAEKTIKGKKRGKDKKKFALALVKTAFSTLQSLDELSVHPLLRQVEAQIEIEVKNLNLLPELDPVEVFNPSKHPIPFLGSKREIILTIPELISIIEAARGTK